MEISAPTGWIKTNKETFWSLLEQVEWRRDAFGNGEKFTLPKYPKDEHGFEKHVATHVDGRYYVNPTFFKPV